MNTNNKVLNKLLAVVMVFAGYCCFWFVDGPFSWLLKQILGFSLVGVGLFLLMRMDKFHFKKILITILMIPSFLLATTSITPKPVLNMVEALLPGVKPVQQNITHAKYSETNEKDQRVLHNIQYGKNFPNSFLDIHFPSNYDKNLGIIIYFHGGGYMWGDKSTGDPNTGSDKDLATEAFLKEGYAVVQVNYALTPEYKFPTPVKQANEAVKFLSVHADKYGINMDRVVLGGGSAGANIAGNLANIISNTEYAKKMDEAAGIDQEKLVGFISLSGLLDNSRFGHTEGSRLVSYLFYQMGRTYTGSNDLKSNSEAILSSNVIDWATINFPSSFISDGNKGTFTDQAKNLHKKLDKLDINNQLVTYPRSVAELTHGYETQGGKEGNETLKKVIDFLKSIE